MEFTVILFDLILAVPLFFLLNWFEQKKNGTSFEINLAHIGCSLIYLVLVTGMLELLGLSYFTQNIFLVVFFEAIYRFIYLHYVWERESFVNRKAYLMIFAITILLAYLLDVSFLSKVETVFPDANEMKTVVWLLIILFLYLSFKDQVRLDFMKESTTTFAKKKEYVVTSYAKLKMKYHDEVTKFKNKQLVPLFYAMMVYENYQHPPVVRYVRERFFGRKQSTYGVMQIPSSIPLTDLQSIEKSMEKIEQIMKKSKMTKSNFDAVKILKEYYQKDEIVTNIMEIYQDIVSFDEV